jgi:hypothetical protein
MNVSILKWTGVALVAVVVAGSLVALGRLSVDTEGPRNSAYDAGHSDGYFQGLAAGQATGLQEGRALQEGIALPADAQAPVESAFTAGYLAGANDAFNQYDGGWALDEPYLITLESGGAGVTYRIGSRVPMQANVDYFLCPDGRGLCQEPRP